MVKKITGELKETSGQFEIEWQISDFLSLSSENGATFYSPMCFLTDSSWYLEVQVGVKKDDDDEGDMGHIGVYLVRGDSGAPKSVTYSLFLKKITGRETLLRNSKDAFGAINKGWGVVNLTRCKLIEQKSEFMPSGALIVICSLNCDEKRTLRAEEMLKEVMRDSIDSTDAENQTETNTTDAKIQTENDIGIEKLLDDVKSLVTSGDHSDVTIKVQEEEFRLHRTILGARTPVFNATLKHELNENTTGIVPVDNIESSTFRTFVHYLYTGSTELLSSENALSLFKMADRYEMNHLKESCLGIIKKRPISVDNFVDVVEFALNHEMEELMERATDFLSENMAEVMVTEKWLSFLKNKLKEANELVVQAAIRKEESIHT